MNAPEGLQIKYNCGSKAIHLTSNLFLHKGRDFRFKDLVIRFRVKLDISEKSIPLPGRINRLSTETNKGRPRKPGYRVSGGSLQVHPHKLL